MRGVHGCKTVVLKAEASLVRVRIGATEPLADPVGIPSIEKPSGQLDSLGN